MRMNKMLASLVTGATVVMAMSSAMAADVTGAGASFPYPVYAKWAENYKAATQNSVNYQSVGSSAGIKQIKAKTVDFGASDMPLSAADLDAAGLFQFPAIMGGVVTIVNLPGIAPGAMKLTGPVVADIYLGKITKWNAPEIAALNPGVKLPADDITVVYRADGSGTSFLFTDYLSKTSPSFKTTIGAGATVKWPPVSAARATTALLQTSSVSRARSATLSGLTRRRTALRTPS
jgi:phosphate transport system substrate-binding protein